MELLMDSESSRKLHGTSLSGLTTDEAMVMSGDTESLTEFCYDLAEDNFTIKRLDAEFKPVEKIFMIDDNYKMFLCSTGDDDHCRELRGYLIDMFLKYGWYIPFRRYADQLQWKITQINCPDSDKPKAMLGGFDNFKVDQLMVSAVIDKKEDAVIVIGENTIRCNQVVETLVERGRAAAAFDSGMDQRHLLGSGQTLVSTRAAAHQISVTGDANVIHFEVPHINLLLGWLKAEGGNARKTLVVVKDQSRCAEVVEALIQGGIQAGADGYGDTRANRRAAHKEFIKADSVLKILVITDINSYAKKDARENARVINFDLTKFDELLDVLRKRKASNKRWPRIVVVESKTRCKEVVAALKNQQLDAYCQVVTDAASYGRISGDSAVFYLDRPKFEHLLCMLKKKVESDRTGNARPQTIIVVEDESMCDEISDALATQGVNCSTSAKEAAASTSQKGFSNILVTKDLSGCLDGGMPRVIYFNKVLRVPLLYTVSTDFVFPVHDSSERFDCMGCGENIIRMTLTAHFNASKCSLGDAIRLARGSVARSADDGSANGHVRTVAVTEDGLVHCSMDDIAKVREAYGLRPLKKLLV